MGRGEKWSIECLLPSSATIQKTEKREEIINGNLI